MQAAQPASRLRLLAKLAAARIVSDRRLPDPLEHLAWVESGAPFEQAGVAGFLDGIDPDLPSAAPGEVGLLLEGLDGRRPATLAGTYLSTKRRALRHATGEYYTPAWLVDLVLDRAGFDGGGEQRLVDPMCGAGAFLAAAIARLKRRQPGLSAAEIACRVQGIDVNPEAVLMSRAACLEALRGAPLDGPLRLPVLRADVILEEDLPGGFDVVAGNPPWVGWESLPEAYRRATGPLWRRHGLFTGPAGRSMEAMLGRGRKDLCMLATFVAAGKLLRPGGRLSFVITRSVFKSVGAGSGFRRFELAGGTPLRVEAVDDFEQRQLFPGASTRAAVLTLVKGEATRFPVRWIAHPGEGRHPVEQVAEPIDPADPGSAWLTGPAGRVRRMRRLAGPSAYRARAGAYTGGANGVFWVRRRAGGLVTNAVDQGLRALPEVTARVEEDLLFPLLRASEVERFEASPSLWILLSQDPIRRQGRQQQEMERRYPEALRYLERFRDVLAARRDRGSRSLIEHGAPFYTIFSVSPETLAPWKVVWPRIASRVTAAAVGPHQARPVIPQETCSFVACEDSREASFLAGLLNSTRFNEVAAGFTQVGGKSFGAPHLLRHIALPRFQPDLAPHRRLSDLVMRRGRGLDQEELDRAAGAAWGVRSSRRKP